MFSNTYLVSIYISLQNNNKEEKLTMFCKYKSTEIKSKLVSLPRVIRSPKRLFSVFCNINMW